MMKPILSVLRPIGRRLPAPVRARLVQILAHLEARPSGHVSTDGASEANSVSGLSATRIDASADREHANLGGLVDIVISPNEISFAHGTGVLLSRLLEGRSDFIAIRSRTNYGGEQIITPVEALVLPDRVSGRAQIFQQMTEWIAGYRVRNILCAPYFETDLILAIAAQAITGAPLGLWIMDDNCLKNGGIDKKIMAEAIERSSALFAISPELKRQYQSEFRKAMAVLPPLVAPSMIRTKPAKPPKKPSAVMIGNVWSIDLLDKTSRAVEAAGLEVNWYASNPDLWTGSLTSAVLAGRGIKVIDEKSPDNIRAAVTAAACVLVPSDSGDSGAHEAALGAMSLPTRMPFVLATSGTPMIVLGRPGTAAGQFVERFEIGLVAPYDGAALKAAFNQLAEAETQEAIRARAAAVAPRFSFKGAAHFVFDAIASNGRWSDDKYEALFPKDSSAYGIFVEKPVPLHVARDFAEVINLCDRLKSVGFVPDFVMDVGASTAIWSSAVSSVFENARYVLCDPMFSRYPNVWTKPGFELIEAAISDKPGKATFSVSSDLYGSSLINVSGVVSIVDKVTVPLRTVDDIAKEKKLKGRGILKVDVQYAEHLVIEGALKTLASSIDVVVLELTLARAHPEARTLLEIANRMDELGFRVFDTVGGWRIPATGEMEQLDMAFVRKMASFFTQDVL
jgi:FkbM family methyltransferase